MLPHTICQIENVYPDTFSS